MFDHRRFASATGAAPASAPGSASIAWIACVAIVLLLVAGCADDAGAPGVTIVEEGVVSRTLLHIGGETVVPLQPERVATLGYLPTDTLVAMGLNPVAIDQPSEQLADLPRISDALAEAQSIGRLESPNLEALVAAETQVILVHSKFLTPRNFRRLSAIAPTVGLDARTPEDLLMQAGRALAYEDEAEAAIEAYRQNVEAAREALSDVREQGASVAFLRLRPRVVRLYSSNQGPGRLLYEELGLTPGPGVPTEDDELWSNLSFEEIGRIQADYIFLGVDPDAAGRESELRDHPLWTSLPAVEAGNVHPVPAILWIAGDDAPIGSEAILADVVDALGSVDDHTTSRARRSQP